MPGRPTTAAPHARRRRRRVVGVPLVVAVVILVLAEGAVRIGHSHLPAPSAWPSPELQKKYDQIVARQAHHTSTDVVLVGDSMMDAAGDPAALAASTGLSIYNASIAGETLPTIADWTTEVVVPRLHPKLVVVGFSSNELDPSILLPASGFPAYNASRAVRAAEGTGDWVDDADAFLRQWSYLYRYRSVLRHPLDNSDAGVFNPTLTTSGEDLAFLHQQYRGLAGGPKSIAVMADVIDTLKGFTVGPANVAILANLLSTLHRKAIAVLLIAMPVTADLVSFHPHGAADYDKALSAFAAVAKSTGASYVVSGVWSNAEFADPVHVNAAGTALFSRYLAPLLTSTSRSKGGPS